jgi:hypothetical protein
MCVIEHIRLRRHASLVESGNATQREQLQACYNALMTIFFLHLQTNNQTNKQTNKQTNDKATSRPTSTSSDIGHPTSPCEKRTAHSAQVARRTHPKAGGMAGEVRGAKGLRRHSNSQCPPPCNLRPAPNLRLDTAPAKTRGGGCAGESRGARPPAAAARCPSGTAALRSSSVSPPRCGQVCRITESVQHLGHLAFGGRSCSQAPPESDIAQPLRLHNVLLPNL